MKKIIIFLVVIIGLFALISFLTNKQTKEKTEGNPYGKDTLDSATIDQLDDPNYQNIILPEELEKKLEDKEDVAVYFYSPLCPHCKNTTPILAPLAEEMGIDLEQYNLLEFGDGFDEYGIQETPTLVYYKDGVEQDRIVGSQDADTFTEWFNKNEVSK